ncbi:hypothetical protein XA68_15532 [Ophiocordyceps unilateralis]|uniref:Uncharacterized protein n=1 Tax=Ophiocordyceps unilateralis TaxID=268505 RepID=A0A2A9PM88_OPHUN|nr:hypothetical protein XA68_15532 [Ophiocordyceps unilateralis]
MSQSARLRRPFQPPDSDSDSQPDALDEQEQEAVISRLVAENATRDRRFRHFLLALPLVASLPYLLLLPSLLAILSLTSLSATAFLLFRLPPHRTGIDALDEWASPSRQRPVPGPSHKSPLETHLPWLNAVSAALLVLMGLLSASTSQGGLAWIGAGNLPAIVYITVLVAKCVMGGFDPEVELSALKYNYKGA